MSSALWVLLGTAAVVVVFGLAWHWRSGRIRVQQGASPLPPAVFAELPELRPGSTGVTLLQLSTTFCAPCQQASALLADLASGTPGVRHVEIDLTDRPELSDALRVRSTPTTVALDSQGRELLRLVGVPRRDALLTALRPHVYNPR